MENLQSETEISSAVGDMTERNNEASRLIVSSSSAKPSYLNLVSNVCAVIFVGIIFYCCFKNGVSLFSFHPTLISLGWIMFMASAINAITPGDIATEWMPVRLRSARHWILQVIGGTIIIVGFLVILSNKIINDKPHFVSLHAKFGLASLLLMSGTMLGGIGALYSLKLKHYLAPIYTKIIHASVGLITFVLGMVTIILGLFSHWWSFGEILRYTSLTLVLVIMLFTILRPTLKIFFRLKERLENVN